MQRLPHLQLGLQLVLKRKRLPVQYVQVREGRPVGNEADQLNRRLKWPVGDHKLAPDYDQQWLQPALLVVPDDTQHQQHAERPGGQHAGGRQL